MSDKWDQRMMELARLVATWSKDPSTKTGAVVATTETHQVLGLGYNGFPRGVQDREERYADRLVKYRMIVHCEANALMAASAHGYLMVAGSSLYTTKHPCSECTKLLIQAAVGEVICPRRDPTNESDTRWLEDAQWSMQMLSEAGIGVREL